MSSLMAILLDSLGCTCHFRFVIKGLPHANDGE